MFLKKRGTQTADDSSLQVPVNGEKNSLCNKATTKIKKILNSTGLSAAIVKKAVVIVILSLLVQVILSTVLSTIVNVIYGSKMMDFFELYVQIDRNVSVFHPWLLLRMANLNYPGFEFAVNILGKTETAVIAMKLHILILLIIPAIGFYAAWFLYQKYIEKNKLEEGSSIKITYIIIAVYTLLFSAASLCSTGLLKTEEIRLNIIYSFWSAFIGAFIVAALINMGILILQKKLILKEKIRTDIYFLFQIVGNFFIISFIISAISCIAIIIVTAAKMKSINAFVSMILSAPNMLLMTMQLLLGGGIQTKFGEQINYIREFVIGNTGLSVLITLLVTVLVVNLILDLELLYKYYMEEYWKYVGILVSLVVIMQTVFYFLSRITIKLYSGVEFKGLLDSELSTIYIKTNLMTVIAVSIFCILFSAIVINFCYDSVRYNLAREALVNNENKLIKTVLVLAFLLPSIFSIMTNSTDTKKEVLQSCIEPDNLFVYNSGYLIESGQSFYYIKDGEMKVLPEGWKNYAVIDTREKNEMAVVNAGDGLSIVNLKGKQSIKDKIKFDQVAAVSEDASVIVYWLDGRLMINDFKKGMTREVKTGEMKFRVADSTVKFGPDEKYLYIVNSVQAVSYSMKTGKVQKLNTSYISYVKTSDNLYLIRDMEKAPISIDAFKAANYFLKKEGGYYSLIHSSGDGLQSTMITGIDTVFYSDYEKGKIIFRFYSGNGDYYKYDAVKNRLTNISAQIRYSSYQLLDKGGK